jgi:hypothetical protein
MIGQTVNDLPDSLKEILYWRGAKELYQAARHKENGKERGIVGVIYQAVSQAKKGRLDDLETTVANTDAVEVSSDTANEQRVA